MSARTQMLAGPLVKLARARDDARSGRAMAKPQQPKARGRKGGSDALRRGRACFEQSEWLEAHRLLLQADGQGGLGAEDLELLAEAAYLIGSEDEALEHRERAHRAHLGAGAELRAARCAFWLGMHCVFRGDTGRASGWFGRAGRILEAHQNVVEHGYMLLPTVHQRTAAGDLTGAEEAGARAHAIGLHHGDRELAAIALHLRGRAAISAGRVAEGLALLDETMVAVTSDELSSRVRGLIYCSVIEGCHQVCAIGRAGEWTEALSRFCERQPTMQSFTGKCLIHRAEIMQLHGAWPDALAEAERACERFRQGADRESPAAAYYQQGEVHRMRGELQAAQDAYLQAGEVGGDPQPGLALLRLAQGQSGAAHAAVTRALSARGAPMQRARLLPAQVEIAIAVGELDTAREASAELIGIAERFGTEVLCAQAAQMRGAVELAGGEAAAALRSLGRALDFWGQASVPYQIARTRVLLAETCAALGDSDGRELQRRAARAGFEKLGAALDLATLDGDASRSPAHGHGLSRRELEVLRLVATGGTNKAIAAELHLSVKTIDRHVSNILTKLDVPSRAAATAYAYEHGLV